MAYIVPRYIALADLEQRVGARTVAQFFDDDGDGNADAATVDTFIAEASAYADSLLVASFGVQVLPQHGNPSSNGVAGPLPPGQDVRRQRRATR